MWLTRNQDRDLRSLLARIETASRPTGDIVAAAGDIRSNYRAHSIAARTVAERFFDAKLVLSSLLERIGMGC